MSVARWTDPALIRRAHRWLRSAAAKSGFRVRGEIEQPHIRPWSTVFHANTTRGAVYLKVCGASQAHEPKLTELLTRVAARDVPTVLARHPREDWMLLADGGKKLRDVFSGPELLRAWEPILPRYAEIQIALLGRVPELLATGTPDRRLERLASDVAVILDDKTVKRRPGADQLSRDDRRRIRAALPAIEARCAELAAVGIGPTIQHDDLHDGNVLRLGQRTVIFDWGDACVSHPFESLMVALRAAAHRAKVRESDRPILRLRDAYLEPFSGFASPQRLRRAASIARRLGMVTRALTWYRVARLTRTELLTESGPAWLRDLPRAFPSERDLRRRRSDAADA